MERRLTVILSISLLRAPEIPVRRHLRDGPALQQGPDPLARAAHQQRRAVARPNVADAGIGELAKVGQGELAIGRQHVEQVVRGQGALGGRGLGGADIHAGIDLARVSRDDSRR